MTSSNMRKLINLCNVAIDHKKTCRSDACGVSLTILKGIAMDYYVRIVTNNDLAEIQQAETMIKNVDWL